MFEIKDPYFKRESLKYKNPIPSREYILSVVSDKKYTKNELFDILTLEENQKKAFSQRIAAMIRDKQLSLSSKKEVCLYDKNKTFIGTVIATTKSFGFVKLKNKDCRDLKLSSKQMQLVFHGEEVRVRVLSSKSSRLEAEIVEIIKRTETLVGRLHLDKEESYIVVDDERIKHIVFIKDIDSSKYQNGQMVIVKIIKYPSFKEVAEGKIIKVLGEYLGEGIEIESAIHKHNIPYIFSDETLLEVKNINSEISTKDKKDRVDLTNLNFVTIDGEDSKDFDDAVYTEITADAWKLWVAIADVSHYVKPNTLLDKQAFERGNSVYFPNRVIPMLPEKLSNNLCSLNPNVERLVMVCEMKINFTGELLEYSVYDSIIKSKARMTYSEVSQILEANCKKLTKKYKNVIENLNTLYGLYKSLRIAKYKRGALDFERTESHILFNDKAKIAKIVATERNNAHRIIEECMVLANRAIAQYLIEENAEFLHRSHPKPKAEKILALKQFLSALGLTMGGDKEPTSKDFAKVLKKIKGRIDEDIIQIVILRSMQQAYYSTENIGHYGLSLNEYTHFTSPIRRYSDLLVHRDIKNTFKNKRKSNKLNFKNIGMHLSVTERRADEATRDVEQWLKCEFMKDKIGEKFIGLIVGVHSFGLFIELKKVLIEGLLHVKDLKNDYFVFDEIHHKLVGRHSNKIYKLGDEVKIQVANVNLEDRKIDFVAAH